MQPLLLYKMSTAASQPDLIIALSHDMVQINLSGQPDTGRTQWKTSFEISGLFLNDQIAQSLDQLMMDNPSLIAQFPCVEIVVMDRPNITLPQLYIDNGQLPEIASRYLRLRLGDTLATDNAGTDNVFCFTVPTETLQLLKEYYANFRITHFSAVLWQQLSERQSGLDKSKSALYLTCLQGVLIILAQRNGKLIFSKNISVTGETDFLYYSVAISRMLNLEEHWLISIQDEEAGFEVPFDSVLRIDQRLVLPNIHELLAQHKPCEL